MPLSRDQILATKGRLKTETVHVPEWATDGEDTVIVRELTGEERDAFESQLTVQRPVFGPERGAVQRMEDVPDHANVSAKLVAKAIVGEPAEGELYGQRLFTDADIIALGELSASALGRCFKAIAELSGMNDTAVADAEKNSGTGPSDGTTSASPETPDSAPPSG